jgi:isoleucyl-tRNA synthetase
LKISKKEIKNPIRFAECKGADLVESVRTINAIGIPYQNAENAFRVISGDFVTTEDGTGIVHTSPTLVR